MKSGSTRQISPSTHWCFTFNNYTTEDLKELVPRLDSLCNKYVFQEEVGAESKIRHLQGYVAFKQKTRPVGLFNNTGMHWEKCRSIHKSIIYCQKSDTRPVDGRVWRRGVKHIQELKYIGNLRD